MTPKFNSSSEVPAGYAYVLDRFAKVTDDDDCLTV
jgi:hypothetical protein